MPALPYLAYADAPAAVDFLITAYGFRVLQRVDTPNGGVGHAELALGDAKVMLASAWPDAGLVSPLDLGAVHCSVWCEVDDVDRHYQQAFDAGAVVIGPPTTQYFGFRTYRSIDPEAHRWDFASPVQ